jgi:hypothetical protein
MSRNDIVKTDGSINYNYLGDSIDGLSSQMADIAKQYISSTKPPLPLSGFVNGEDISDKLIALLQYAKQIADANGGHAPIIIVPSGTYTITKQIVIYTYQKILFIGNVTINVVGLADAAFRIKNDNNHDQGYESDFNNFVLDASLGKLYLHGDDTTGSKGIVLGNEPNYASDGYHYSAFTGLNNININHFYVGLQHTRNSTFAQRYLHLKITDNNIGFLIENDGNDSVNSGELSHFTNCFINNNNIGLSLYGHEISLVNTSVSFNHVPVQFTGGSTLHITNCHIEKAENEFFRNTSTSIPKVHLNNVSFVATNFSTAGFFVRKWFVGKMILNAHNIFTNYTSLTTSIGDIFMCDDNVEVINTKFLSMPARGILQYNGEIRQLISKGTVQNYNAEMSDTEGTGKYTFAVFSGAGDPSYEFDTETQYNEHSSLKLTTTTNRPMITTPPIKCSKGDTIVADGAFNTKNLTAGFLAYRINFLDESKNILASSILDSTHELHFDNFSTDEWVKTKTGMFEKCNTNGTFYATLDLIMSSDSVGAINIGALYIENQ